MHRFRLSRLKRSSVGTLAGVDFVNRVEKLLKKRDKTLSLEGVSVALLTCGNPAVIQKELHTLREYRYGKPKEAH